MTHKLTERQAELLTSGLSELGLPVRTQNQLESVGIYTIEQLLMTQQTKLMAVPNIGDKTISEIFLSLEKVGFYRDSKEEPCASNNPKAKRKNTDRRRRSHPHL